MGHTLHTQIPTHTVHTTLRKLLKTYVFANMVPGWLVLFAALVAESVVVGLLVLPMPSNNVRRNLLEWLTRVWDRNSHFRSACYIVLALDAWYFSSTMAGMRPGEDQYLTPTCEQRLHKFRHQRNAYITGF